LWQGYANSSLWSRYYGSGGWSSWVRLDAGGTQVAPTLASGVSLDTVQADGWTTVLNANNNAGRPEPTGSGMVRTGYASATSGVQLWLSLGSTQSVFHRFRGSTGWSAWHRVDTPLSPMEPYRKALAQRATTPVQIMCVGDSRTEGTGTSDVSLRWQTRMQKYLRERLSPVPGALFPFIPGYPVTSAPGMPVTIAGTVTRDTTYGLGWRTAKLADSTSSLTFTFTGTSCKVMYTKASSTAKMLIAIDGGAAVSVETNSTIVGASNSAVWSSPALTAGAHTVVITRDPATTNSAWQVYVQGLLTYNGDEAAGIRVLDSGYHGSSSTFFTSTRNSMEAAALTAAGGASLIVIGMGTNDAGSTTPATFQTNLLNFINAMRNSAGFTGSFLLLNFTKPNAQTEATYAAIGEQMALIAAGDPLIEYLDMRRDMPDNPTPYTATAGLGLYNDNIHENDAGHAWIAGRMAARLVVT
ncbi:MAG TPA: hypothetical protein VFJ94_14535, partial [Intrasporangium sp.]|uniref:hypothetical protein n=1 Tax=Intrasporangium sp. TaxID=1925024 RepID=UPI002D767834